MKNKKQGHSQENDVLQYLKDYGKITSLDAFREFGATRLSAIIYRLRHIHGYIIELHWKQYTNKYGNNVNYAEYTLME